MDEYLWVKAVHIIAVIAWMAGLLYLPRLYVYHCGARPGSPASEMLKTMERRLFRAIMTPAMVVATGLGLALLRLAGSIDGEAHWLHLKLVLVVLLLGLHFLLGRWRKDFERDRNRRSTRFYRIVNEVPTVLMIGIVIAVIVKPF
jgi:putative membrane protein